MADTVSLKRKSYASIREVLPLPNLIETQLQSFKWFQEKGLRELFDEITPIQSFNKKLELHFLDYRFDEPKYTEGECRERGMTFSAPLWVWARLINKDTGEIQEQEVFMGDFPIMTDNAVFVINGVDRVVVSQLIRSPGAYFDVEEDRTTGRFLCQAKLIPDRGAWMEFETRRRDDIAVKVNRKRRMPVTILLRALANIDDGADQEIIKEGSDEELLELFSAVDSTSDHHYIKATMEQEPLLEPSDERTVAQEALLEFYKRMRPGEPPTLENAKGFLTSLLFTPRRYDLGRVGRHKLNGRLGLSIPLSKRTLTKSDLVKVVEHIIQVNNGLEGPDDIDHLGNRRVKTIGELIQNQMRIGLLRMERVVRERMSIRDPEQALPVSLINIRPVVAAMKGFFGASQLSQFMDQTNPLAELTHKRTLSALGPGGLKRERAGFDVRDVHHSHYGRICPIETPEGPNIGLIGRLATYGQVNEYGFIETPYRRVLKTMPNNSEAMVDKELRGRVVDPETDELVAEVGTVITPQLAERIASLPATQIKIRPIVTSEIVYLSADEEDRYTIAQANAKLDERGQFVEGKVSVRRAQQFMLEVVDKVDFMDVSPKQIVGVSASLISFLEHDDANRALMGSNMQRQAVPLIAPEVPTVGTGIERQVARDSGQVVIAVEDGEVIGVTSEQTTIAGPNGNRVYPLCRFNRSNQGTCLDQRPIVNEGDSVKAGDVIADCSSSRGGELALGQNVLVAFLSWEGGNYEDAILISEGLVREDEFTSIHIEKHELEARDTRLGPEEVTRDIPNVGEDALRDLDEDGIIRIGAEVRPNDILVGKITPKGERELTPEEKLLRAIFGEKARDVKDSSLRLPHGEQGRVVDIRRFSREECPDLSVGVNELVRVNVAQRRKIKEGDKIAGRHGNKGVISKVVPIEDMPFLADGTPVEIILNPLGVPSRMNIGQILETHLGWAADRLGMKVISPVFDGADEEEIAAELGRAWLIDRAWDELTEQAWQWLREQEYDPEEITDDEEARRLYLSHIFEGDEAILSDRLEARRVFFKHWLRDQGYDPREILVFEGYERSPAEREEADQRAVKICLRFWLKEAMGGDEALDIDQMSDEEVQLKALHLSKETGTPLPTSGKMILYDGKTGEPFDHPVTIGVIYMMKLAHLVEDKVHARSTGPYSLITQQPLGGKAQFGGQRFGEMEVWALEAYGAAHTLQEMLTIKSDDVTGRVKAYESIVKGEPIRQPGIPESFRVLVKELQGLGLSVEARDEDGEWIRFGKDEEEQPSKWWLGLRSLGSRKGG